MNKTSVSGRIAVFASGNGSNAENIIRYFREADRGAEVALVVTNKAEAGVIGRAGRLGVDCRIMTPAEIRDPEIMLPLLESYGVDLIVLAGFLLMVPQFLIARYPDRIINIHPALLPKFGGKGMYGRHVHEAVVAAGECETGITVHFVSEKYDEGRIIAQVRTDLSPADTPADVEAKIHRLEQENFPRIIRETFYN
ncbi:MAG: phosphoribosylglycinamide formyltransferase [Duncaniella sp.]|uniref:phosphoribosylglycinamide formyltransferase n=1 Tax=Duncaniella sp. TaxID=2518496 RepID=UPI0023BFBB8D|nr:phosphoribosylglycinamide formyltransferase [Duncaniella sp.]MDE5988095.1 phosphoribosylglycinamide formyltransferase [Duncaniella sp.]